ncbi:dna repair protein rad5 [Moniliophthora roreri MCA 2997]|uniref:Dna repair protein rad5 n=1 Tax=Moniliophthora roreri (strain MCA 2997) TaxID=1381753 RepID=V2XYX2_MONRO|nr:dna repair protein rad5 [Moniliophthora roreri MCA 2997]
MSEAIVPLYRSYLRAVKRLPHQRLRDFFRIKASEDLKAIRDTKNTPLQQRKIKRVSRQVRKIEAACNGSTDAFDHVLDLAYGRKGKLRWEIMQPLLIDPSKPIPSPIIKSVPKSRPPVYSKELTVLHTSVYSRRTKVLPLQHLSFPPTLSPRAEPSSEEARTLGPLSKRREVNTRWRYFVQEWKKIYPPLDVIVRDATNGSESSSRAAVSQANIRDVGFQGQHLLEEIEALVGPSYHSRPAPRRGEESTPSGRERLPRWLRRRYQALLARLPALVYTHNPSKSTGKYSVELSTNAISNRTRDQPCRQPELDTENLAWYQKSLAQKS